MFPASSGLWRSGSATAGQLILHRYARPSAAPGFRLRPPDDLIQLRLTGLMVDVDWSGDPDLGVTVPAFGRLSAPVDVEVTSAPIPFIVPRSASGNAFAGVSISGLPFKAPQVPYCTESEPVGTDNIVLWISKDRKISKRVRRRHCYVTEGPLPEGFAILKDRWPGHGLIIPTRSLALGPAQRTNFGSLVVSVPQLQAMSWSYELTVLMMDANEYQRMTRKEDPSPPVKLHDELCDRIVGLLREAEFTADCDEDADDALFAQKALEAHPGVTFAQLREVVGPEILSLIVSLLESFSAVAEFDEDALDAYAAVQELKAIFGDLRGPISLRVPRSYPQIYHL